MTICIAAICLEGTAAVVCADRQVTVPNLNLEVERAKSKLVELASGQIGMSAGDGLTADEIFLHVREALHGAANPTVLEAAQVTHDVYVQFRQRVIQDRFLRPIGYDLPRFQEHGLRQLGPQVHAGLLQQLANFDIGCELLVTGASNRRLRIAHIGHPGMLRWADGMEFFAIGSGTQHVISSLLLAGYSTTWSIARVLVEVYSAKRNAERAPGVGNMTDLKVVRANEVKCVTDATLRELGTIYQRRLDAQANQDQNEIEVMFDDN